MGPPKSHRPASFVAGFALPLPGMQAWVGCTEGFRGGCTGRRRQSTVLVGPLSEGELPGPGKKSPDRVCGVTTGLATELEEWGVWPDKVHGLGDRTPTTWTRFRPSPQDQECRQRKSRAASGASHTVPEREEGREPLIAAGAGSTLCPRHQSLKCCSGTDP